MNKVREIVTKAIVGKGKKRFKIEEQIKSEINPYSILGCWVINNNFDAKLNGKKVTITGSFELNVWYSSNNNTKTDVVRKKISYKKELLTKKVVVDYLEDSADVIVKVIQQPTCTNAKIVDNKIEVEIIFELLAEIIGETKMQVTILDKAIEFDDDEFNDIEDEIDENFIKE